jgi:hypothetical protein
VAVCAQLEEPLRIACAGGGSKCTISPCLEDLVQVGRQRYCPEGLRIMKAGVTLKGALAQAKLRLVDVGQLRAAGGGGVQCFSSQPAIPSKAARCARVSCDVGE